MVVDRNQHIILFPKSHLQIWPELGWIVFVQAVVVCGKITLLGDPELDGIVFQFYKCKPNASQTREQER